MRSQIVNRTLLTDGTLNPKKRKRVQRKVTKTPTTGEEKVKEINNHPGHQNGTFIQLAVEAEEEEAMVNQKVYLHLNRNMLSARICLFTSINLRIKNDSNNNAILSKNNLKWRKLCT